MSDPPKNPEDDAAGSAPTAPAPRIPYPDLVQDALRRVVREALTQVADLGLPGEHHFYIAFATEAPGVGLSDSLRARFPEEMTIVIQHDYRDLEVDDVGFDVTLRFGGVPQVVRVPFTALVSFYDPAVQFMLRFEPEAGASDSEDDLGPRAVGSDEGEGESPRRIPTDVLRTAGEKGPRAVRPPRDADEDQAGDAGDDGDDGDDGDGDGPSGEVVSFESFKRK